MSGALKLSSGPLKDSEFRALLKTIAPLAKKVAIAVSGGPDSMALAYAMKKWGKQSLIAFIVDHRLRKTSSREAAVVKSRLEAMGIKTHILPWQHGALKSQIHIKARQARYDLLLGACRHHGVRDLLLAHQREDQAETILMRFAKGSGLHGLAGIKAVSERQDIRLLRPFLPVPKERLIATCKQAKISFISDPSNASDLYARGRLRKVMPSLAREGLTIDTLITLGARADESQAAIDHYAHQFLKQTVRTEMGGNIQFDKSLFRSVPRAVALQALALCLRYVHDDDYPPSYASLSSLYEGLLSSVKLTQTFYGCITALSGTKIAIFREPAAATEALPLKGGATLLWDNRWLVTAERGAEPTLVRALGTLPHALSDRFAPRLRRLIPQGRIRATLPGLWKGEKLLAIPSFDKKTAFRLCWRKRDDVFAKML